MAKLYYGDSNNKAVEINLGGGVSGDYLPLNITEDTTVNMEGISDITFSGNAVKFDDGIVISANAARSNVYSEIVFSGNVSFGNQYVQFNDHAPISRVAPTSDLEITNKQYVDSNFPLSPTIRNITVVTALPSSPDPNTLYLIQG